jgi:hypothetical protein
MERPNQIPVGSYKLLRSLSVADTPLAFDRFVANLWLFVLVTPVVLLCVTVAVRASPL